MVSCSLSFEVKDFSILFLGRVCVAVIGSGLCINLVVAVATSRVFLQKNVDSQQAEQVSENGGIPQVISIKEDL